MRPAYNLDEVRNVVDIGVANEAAAAEVVTIARRLSVPAGALRTHVAPGKTVVLDRFVPFDLLRYLGAEPGRYRAVAVVRADGEDLHADVGFIDVPLGQTSGP